MEKRGLEFEKQLAEFENKLVELKDLASSFSPDLSTVIRAIEKQFLKEKQRLYSRLTPWQKVLISKHVHRPRSLDYINVLMENRIELFGDRIFKDDPALIGGLAKFRGYDVVFMGQEKGRDTSERIARNFGLMHPEGYRKALRLMKLAEKFNKPVITFVDTQGAAVDAGAEIRGQPMAISENLLEMSALKVPIICVVIGEGGSGGALGISVGDRILMLENAIYSVCTPETCCQILKRDPDYIPKAAADLKLTASELKELDIIDDIIKEPLGGAHKDPRLAINRVGRALKRNLDLLKNVEIEELVEKRYQKYRNIGQFLQPDRVEAGCSD